jgi:Tetratricopeptide repeat
VIEQLIEAERALTHGLVDQAERLYRQVAGLDPKNSIAVVGLARVALERGDDRTAYVEARRALAIDPDNPAAQHLVMRLAEVMAGRGETPPDVDDAEAATPVDVVGAAPKPAEPDPTPPGPATPATPPPPAPSPAQRPVVPAPPPAARRRRSVVDRLLGRRR